ncbi:hypothetical protein BaRGS_00000059 [Batillaria attramentaria]|uniref:Uncharacterized protein n=1 Tax=Batillaria attramentaria TaxID=370345 RepID=A0ABD0M9F6_9CAEN
MSKKGQTEKRNRGKKENEAARLKQTGIALLLAEIRAIVSFLTTVEERGDSRRRRSAIYRSVDELFLLLSMGGNTCQLYPARLSARLSLTALILRFRAAELILRVGVEWKRNGTTPTPHA